VTMPLTAWLHHRAFQQRRQSPLSLSAPSSAPFFAMLGPLVPDLCSHCGLCQELLSLQNGLVGSPCSPKDSQESSPTPQFKSIKYTHKHVYGEKDNLGSFILMTIKLISQYIITYSFIYQWSLRLL